MKNFYLLNWLFFLKDYHIWVSHFRGLSCPRNRKSSLSRFFWIPAFAGMTIMILSNRPAFAESWQKFEFKAAQTHYFYDRASHSINDGYEIDTNVVLHHNNEKNFLIHATPRLRLDFTDSNRNQYLPLDSYLGFYNENLDFRMGLQKVKWGNGAFYSPTDIINRSDLAGHYILREKLADPIVSLAYENQSSAKENKFGFELHVVPLFLETPLPQNESRFALSGEQNNIPFDLTDNQDHPSYTQAMSIGTSVYTYNDIWDIRLFAYRGIDHNPGYALKVDSNGALKLAPFYYSVYQFGFQTSTQINAFTLKTNLATFITNHNDAYPHDIQPVDDDAIPNNYTDYLVGFDYELNTKAKDSSQKISVEYLGSSTQNQGYSNPKLLQSDVLISLQSLSYAKSSTQFSIGVIKDIGSTEWLGLLDVSRAFFNNFRAGTQIYYTDLASSSALSLFSNNTSIKTYLTYHFGNEGK